MDCYCDDSFFLVLVSDPLVLLVAHREGKKKKYHGFMAVNFQEAKIISIVQIHI
jgi:hypothetical protein